MKLQNVIHIVIGLVCVGLLPGAQAVVPPPDGGYPNFTTAEGQNALKSLTTGAANTAVGWYSLFTERSWELQHRCWRWNACFQHGGGQYGHLALLRSCSTPLARTTQPTEHRGVVNNIDRRAKYRHSVPLPSIATAKATSITLQSALERYAPTRPASPTQQLVLARLLVISTAAATQRPMSLRSMLTTTAPSTRPLALLRSASNTTGSNNTAMGSGALATNTVASSNTATGVGALANSNTDNNTATGFNALFNNTTGPSNTAYGFSALFNNSTGGFNTAIGL